MELQITENISILYLMFISCSVSFNCMVIKKNLLEWCMLPKYILGHFIVLHTAGIPIQFVFLVISLTYIASILGVLVGVALGTEFRAVDWIFAITTGMFLHVAMVQLVSTHTSLAVV